jgi:tetratricopeptide (TPR) repeat protein
VIATGGVNRYGDVQKQPAEIGKEIGVDGVLDGSFQRVNGKLRVTLRLIHSPNGAQLWSGSFDESESEIFHLQDAMARETARAMALTLRPQEITKRPTDSVDAYNHFLKGDYLLRQRGEDNVKRSEGFFREAVSIDPYYSRAWAGLAAAQSMRTDIETAERTVAHALELDPNLAEAHATRGFILMFHYWNWPGAESSLNRASNWTRIRSMRITGGGCCIRFTGG